MIRFNCQSCGQSYKVPDEKGGIRAKCKKCAAVMQVPAAVEASPAAPAARQVAAPKSRSSAAAPSPPRQPAPPVIPTIAASSGLAAGGFDLDDDFSSAAAVPDYAGDGARSGPSKAKVAKLPGRPYAGDEEVRIRAQIVMATGIVLIVAFFLPMIGPRGELAWVNLQGVLESMMPMGFRLLMLLPLVAGLVALFGRGLPPMVRGITLIVLGLLPLILFFTTVPADFTRGFKTAMSAPGAAKGLLSMLLMFLMVYGVMIGCRLRWYRPALPAAWPIALTGAIATGLLLIWPGEGTIGLLAPFQLMKRDTVIGIGTLLWVLSLVATVVLIAITTPSTPLKAASTRANLTFWIFVGGFCALILLSMIRSMGGADILMALSILVKMGTWMGATFVLIPMGVVDIVIGQPVTEPGKCTSCGYDLTGAASEACPECGAIA